MKRALLIFACCALPAHATEPEHVFDGVRPSVVTVTSRDELNQIDSEGSGVVIADHRVITNCHVVHEANTIQIRSGDKTLPATRTLSDAARDLCLLDVPELTAPPAKIRPLRELAAGEEIYVVGNPLGLGLSVSTGLISSIGQYKGETQIYSSAPVSPGSSGGGLFDAQGRLAGIVTGFFSPAQNFNIALPADWIAEIPGRAKLAPPADLTRDADTDWLSETNALRISGQWAKLAELTQQWLAAYPTSTQAYHFLGVALYNQKQYHEAEAALLEAIRLYPYNIAAQGFLAVTRQGLGNIEAAQKDIQSAIRINPSSSYFWRVQADIQQQAGQLDDAIHSMKTAVHIAPGDEDNWQQLGALLHRQKKLPEAIKAYQTALRLKPDYPLVMTNLASAQASLGQIAAAQQSLISSNGDKTDTLTWLKLGIEEEKNKHFSEAERMYRKALELNPESADAWYLLAQNLLYSNRNAEVENALRQAIKYKPDHEPAWGSLGNFLQKNGDLSGASAAYEKTTIINPTDLAGWIALGGIRQTTHDYAGANTAFEKATQLTPTNINGWLGLSQSQTELKLADEALKSLRAAEKLDPKNLFVNQYLAVYYGSRNDHQQSLLYIDRALEVDRASANSWSNRGYALLKLERYPEAVQSLETATKLNPDFANAWINLGEAQLRQKQLGKAITTLEQAIKLAPDAPDARLYLAQAYRRSGQADKAKEHLAILLQARPNYAPGLYMLTSVHLSEGNQAAGLESYRKLKVISPAMAKDLRDKSRAQEPAPNFTLPD